MMRFSTNSSTVKLDLSFFSNNLILQDFIKFVDLIFRFENDKNTHFFIIFKSSYGQNYGFRRFASTPIFRYR